MRTYLQQDVCRDNYPPRITFAIEDRTVTVECVPDSTCRRCGKGFGEDALMPVVTMTQAPPPSKREMWRVLIMLPGQSRKRYNVGLYHERCIPPNVFHAVAGSRPAPGRSRVAPADVMASPSRAARRGVSGSAIATKD